MKRPTVDYRDFRLHKLRDPEYSHLLLLLGWVVYFCLYFLTEKLIPAERCFVVHTALDDRIPFCEYFLIPYVFWYLLIAFSLGYFLLYNVSSFRDLQTYFIIAQLTANAIYILLPTRQDLRPLFFPRENFLTDCVRLLYTIDTNTGVCPSLHVALSFGLVSVWTKEKGIRTGWKVFVVLSAALICLSTMFVKQHSVLDFFAACPVSLLAEYIVYHRKERKTGSPLGL